MWRPADNYSYSYLLGIYLGDGCLVVPARGNPYLTIALDAAHEEIVEECTMAILLSTVDARPVSVRRHPVDRLVRVRVTMPQGLEAFPQHGPGRKHERPIILEPWQREITEAEPEQFLRGLIHSDGCRTMNRFKTTLPRGRVAHYEYPRYFFSNLSEDILTLFCQHCDLLGIRWTQSNHRNISISHRHSVARLDEFVGPKR